MIRCGLAPSGRLTLRGRRTQGGATLCPRLGCVSPLGYRTISPLGYGRKNVSLYGPTGPSIGGFALNVPNGLGPAFGTTPGG
jgi:hypothetical protein